MEEEVLFSSELEKLTFDTDHIDKTIRASKASIVQVAKSLVAEMKALDRKKSKEDFDFELLDFMEIKLFPLLKNLQEVLFSYQSEEDFIFLSRVFFGMPPRNPRMKRIPRYINRHTDKEAFYKKKAEFDLYNRHIDALTRFTRFDMVVLEKCRTRVLLSLLEKKMYTVDSFYGDGYMDYWEDDTQKSIGSGSCAESMMHHSRLLDRITSINEEYGRMMDEFKAKREEEKASGRDGARFGRRDDRKNPHGNTAPMSWRNSKTMDDKKTTSTKREFSREKNGFKKKQNKPSKAPSSMGWRKSKD